MKLILANEDGRAFVVSNDVESYFRDYSDEEIDHAMANDDLLPNTEDLVNDVHAVLRQIKES